MTSKTALTANISKMTSKFNPNAAEYIPLKPTHTFWDDCPDLKEEVPNAGYSNEWEKKQYAALHHLKKSPSFQRKFATFAENILCVTSQIRTLAGSTSGSTMRTAVASAVTTMVAATSTLAGTTSN